jgi:predicted glycosyltransferase
MKVWYDACTGKHLRYGAAIAERLRALGHEVILTTRNHPDTLPLTKLLKEEAVIVGRYDPASLISRLRMSLRRQLAFCKMFQKTEPDIAISHQSVELCRVAFGLGIPSIATHDTPHAEAANRLTLPLVDFLVVSKALPIHRIKGYMIKKIFSFDGVDEVAWVKNHKPQIKYDYKRPLIVVRELQTKASYAKDKADLTKTLARKLTSLGTVLFLSRYERKQAKGLIVPREFIDSVSLVSQADLVISIGGTIAREAALQGTPTIIVPSITRFDVNDYLAKKGFPIFTVNPEKVFGYGKKLLKKRYNVKNLLERLENPVDVIEKIIKEEIKE